MNNWWGIGLTLVLALGWLFSKYWVEKKEAPSAERFFGLDSAKISEIHIENSKGEIHLRKINGENPEWQLLNKGAEYRTNERLMRSLLYVLKHAEIQQVLNAEQTQAKESNPIAKIILGMQNKKKHQFEVRGDTLAKEGGQRIQDSYGQKDNDKEKHLYKLGLSGYSTYLAGIFMLRAVQFRNRLLFASTPYSLQKVRMTHLQNTKESFSIIIHNDEIRMEGPLLADSVWNEEEIENYLTLFRGFFTNEYIERGQVAYYDSLLNTEPMFLLEVDDVYPEFSKKIAVYMPLEEAQPYVLLREIPKEGEETQIESLSLCEKDRFGVFLRKKRIFLTQKNPIIPK